MQAPVAQMTKELEGLERRIQEEGEESARPEVTECA